STNDNISISNHEREIPRETAAKAFEEIENINKDLGKASLEEKETLLMSRALYYSAVLNLNNAMDDYNQLIELNPSNYLAWFNRAYVRFKMVEIVNQLKAEIPEQKKQLHVGSVNIKSQQNNENDNRILDYDLIIKDLQKVIELNPNFEFAHFNLGMIQCILRDFDKGIVHFSKAIEINPEFAEAWFNRGLTRIYMEEETEGTLDLSKSGELGIFKAYNVIKRYGTRGDKSAEDEEKNSEEDEKQQP
ncbi:MAG: hypothetical protein JXA77_06755, partial [Bacteroidales bacterium]|nr:hypothetical protein [Bacteroidales bacterium]